MPRPAAFNNFVTFSLLWLWATLAHSAGDGQGTVQASSAETAGITRTVAVPPGVFEVDGRVEPIPLRVFTLAPGITLTGPVPEGLRPTKATQPEYLEQYLVLRVAELTQLDSVPRRKLAIHTVALDYFDLHKDESPESFVADSDEYMKTSMAQAVRDLAMTTVSAPVFAEIIEGSPLPAKHAVFHRNYANGYESLCVKVMLPIDRQVVFLDYCTTAPYVVKNTPRSVQELKASAEFKKFIADARVMANPKSWVYRKTSPKNPK